MSPASTPAPATERNTPAPTPVSQPGASQFGQFRLTTFVDANPDPRKMQAGKRKSVSGHGSATQSPVVRPSSVPVGTDKAGNGMNNSDTTSTTTATGNGDNENKALAATAAQAQAPAHRRTASTATKIPTGQHNGFGVLDLTPPLPPAGQGKLGQHRDGRVRNPVPRKLKGKTDMRNGNFSVMHMDMSAHSGDKSIETRGEAAQRTSENTAKAAREALREKAGGGGGVKRRRVDGEGGWDPILSQASQSGALQGGGGLNVLLAPAAPPMPKEIVHRTEGMTPQEVKYEQARLLTLLRSLNPLAVVDQLCTALAFFGGIPGAPPPTENGGSFPESEDANGNGAAFVGWLSEIFPDLQRRRWSCTRVVEREESVVMGKRPRGRPKGSKASKVRKDKGIKKGRKDGLANNASRPGAEDGDDPADDDWVDILEGTSEAALRGGNAQPDGVVVMDLDGVDGTPSQAAGKRKVGRPRGSRNKEKERDADGNEIPSVDAFSLSSPSQQQNHTESGNASSTFEQQSPSEQQPKRKPGRPPGSKTKHKEGEPAPTPRATKAKAAKEGPSTARAKSVVDASIPPGLAADERAVLEAYRKNKALSGPEKVDEPARKKRRSRAKAKAGAAQGAGENGEGEGGDTPTMLAQQLNSQPQPQPTPTQSTTAVPPPPPKRQRKGKEPVISNAAAAKATNNNIDPALQSTPLSASPHLSQNQAQSQPQPRSTQQPARTMSASHTQQNPFASPPMNNMNSAMMSIDSLMPTSTQQGGGGGRTAQGLEAHYERFANQESQSQSPNTYSLGGKLSQPHNQRASPAVPQGIQRTSSQTQQRGGITGSPQKSAMGRVASAAGVSNSGMYYGQNQAQAQQQQQQPQRQQRHIPSQSAGYGYPSGMAQGQQAGRSNSFNLDAFGQTRNAMGQQLPSSSSSQHQRGNSAFGVQNQNQGYFDGANIQGAGYVDLPALETGLGGGGGGYGLATSTGARSASYSGGGMSGGGISGGGMGLTSSGGLFGTEQQGGGLSENEMRERLLRGIGRR